MQLPRGTFRYIKKGVLLGDILIEIKNLRFTGICTFSSGSINGTLVFKDGTCVLAEIQDKYSDAGWEEAQKLADRETDAALSDLDNAQLQLSIEFNKKSLVKKPGKAPAARSQNARITSQPQEQKKQGAAHRKETKEKEFIKTTPVTPAVPLSQVPIEKKQVAPPHDVGKEPAQAEPPVGVEPGPSSAEKDFETFDSMDLDDVTQKIKKDVKVILKQLKLDHLTEK